MDPVLARIDEWQEAGLLDPATAARLRHRERERGVDPGHSSDGDGPRAMRRSVSATDILGPVPTVAEMFGYLGATFLLGAWTAFVGKISATDGQALAGAGFLIAAVALAIVGVALRTGDDRRPRAAGIAFLTATGYSVAGVAGLLGSASVYGPGAQLIVALLAVVVASGIRFIHAGLLTQFGVLVSTTASAWAFLSWLDDVVHPDSYTDKGVPIGATPDPILQIFVNAAVWLILALGLGVLAIQESAARRDSLSAPGAPGRRAALTRAWAGTVAVIGLASALVRSDVLANGDYGRVVPPWITELLLLGLAALLVERAFRRDSSAFLFAAGIGLIAALSDFNFTYLSGSTDTGLLIEGVLLLAVGFAADRLRRRLSGRPGGPSSGAMAPALEPALEAPIAPALEPPLTTIPATPPSEPLGEASPGT